MVLYGSLAVYSNGERGRSRVSQGFAAQVPGTCIAPCATLRLPYLHK